ncbi:hypothetical protein CCYA_CCYA10G2782 [Cyanidiococcus yangmingshanensis]|nr:hypothetical protein CCYA_CCYA10G2782 [Cyanidiococcus yangmingshanensis]
MATQTVVIGCDGEVWPTPQPVKQGRFKENEAFLGPVRVCPLRGWRSLARRSRRTSRCGQYHRPSLRGCTTTEVYSNATERTKPLLLCLLCLSNGHGEDLVATQVLRALYRNAPVPLWTDALPLVGAGEAYKRLAQDQSIHYLEEPLNAYESASSGSTELLTRSSLRLLEPRVTLPSGGFIYARPLTFLKDIAAGLFALVYLQWRRCRYWLSEKMKYVKRVGASKRCFFVLAVGDVWPLFLSVLTGVRLGAFIGTAKSDLYLQTPSGEWLFMQPYPHRWTSDRWVYGLTPTELEAFRLEADETSKLPAWIIWCWRFWRLLVVDLRYALFLYRYRRVWRAPFLWRLARLGEAIGAGASVYLPWERWLLRRSGTLGIYVRDTLTAERLNRLGIRGVAPLALNPMMDDIVVQHGLNLQAPDDVGSFYVTMLPGSRALEAYQNWRRMLRELQGALSESNGIAFRIEVPVASTLAISVLKDIARDQGWRDIDAVDAATFPGADSVPALYEDMIYRHGTSHCLRLWSPPRSNTEARVPHPFAACLHRAAVVFACAGTATEQAVGVGKPVITSPGAGPQFNRSFWEAQSRLLGPNIILADPSREHPDAVSQALVHLCQALQDTQHRQALVLSWRQQAEAVMGHAGAADYIARSVFERLERSIPFQR